MKEKCSCKDFKKTSEKHVEFLFKKHVHIMIRSSCDRHMYSTSNLQGEQRELKVHDLCSGSLEKIRGQSTTCM